MISTLIRAGSAISKLKLIMIIQSFPHVLQEIIPSLIELLALAMRRLYGQPRDFEIVLDEFCHYLASISDQTLIFQSLQTIFDLLEGGTNVKKGGLPQGDITQAINSPENTIELMAYFSNTPANLLLLMRSQSNQDHIQYLLEQYMHCGIRQGHHSNKAASIIQAIDHAVTHLSTTAVIDILHNGIELSDQIEYLETKRNLYIKIIRSVVVSKIFSGKLRLFETLMEQIEIKLNAPQSIALVWASFYKDICDHTQGKAIESWVKNHVKALPAPKEMIDAVQWLSYLFLTPLQPLAQPVSDALFSDLDRFSVGYKEIHSLESYLVSVSPSWTIPTLVSRFKILANWAANMPKVNNEDARHAAFNAIMAAADKIDPAYQPQIEQLILDQASGALGEYSYSSKLSEQAKDTQIADEKLTALHGHDLMKWSQKTITWWIEQAPEFEFTDISREDIIDWAEEFFLQYPQATPLGIIMASAWISQYHPDELPALWYDLATLKALSRDKQLILAGMIVDDLKILPNS